MASLSSSSPLTARLFSSLAPHHRRIRPSSSFFSSSFSSFSKSSIFPSVSSFSSFSSSPLRSTRNSSFASFSSLASASTSTSTSNLSHTNDLNSFTPSSLSGTNLQSSSPSTSSASPSATSTALPSSPSSSSPPRPVRPRKVALSVTSSAARRLKTLLSHQPNSALGIRLGIRSRGCNGLSYTMNYVYPNSIPKLDEVIQAEEGVKVFIDPKALFYVVGSEMDYVDSDLTSEFVFKNPNEKGKCGCGESFNV